MQLRNFLYELNPVCKIVLLIILAIPVTFSQDIFFPFCILLFLVVAGIVFAGLSPLAFWKSMKYAVIAALCLCIFLIATKSFGKMGDIQLGIFGVSYEDLWQAISLALRMLGFAYAAFLFSKTSDPVILTISLIEYWHLPQKAGYAFLSAYRFVPTFHQEFQKIQLADEVRGGQSGQNIFSKMLHFPKYLISLMIQAIRSGERVSIAMEARAFCLHDTKTYTCEVYWGKKENRTILITILYLCISITLLVATNLFRFGVGF